jgi:hypothetical protein
MRGVAMEIRIQRMREEWGQDARRRGREGQSGTVHENYRQKRETEIQTDRRRCRGTEVGRTVVEGEGEEQMEEETDR